MRAHRIMILTGTALLVSACTEFYSVLPRTIIKTAGNVNLVSTGVTMATDKTLVDHVVSFQSGKDCSTVRSEQGRTYCKEDEPNPMPVAYCYRSIGDVTCFTAPDSTRPNDRVGNLN